MWHSKCFFWLWFWRRILVRLVNTWYTALRINLLKSKTYFMYHQLKHSGILCSAHNVFMCFVWISEQTAIISLYSINLSVFITEAESVYCAVRTGSLNQTDTVWYLRGYNVAYMDDKRRFSGIMIVVVEFAVDLWSCSRLRKQTIRSLRPVIHHPRRARSAAFPWVRDST